MAAKKKSGSADLDEMGINEITVSFGVTANLGNYESARVDLTLKAAVPKGISVEEHHANLTLGVSHLFNKQADVLGDVAAKILKDSK